MSEQPSIPNPPMDTSEPSLATKAVPTTSKKSHKRQGKASRARNTDKYRMRTNKQESTSHLHELNAKFGLLGTDETGTLSSAINQVEITPQKRAVPLSATTRGIGVATTIFYDRAAKTWTGEGPGAMSELCTIHQVYRVCLFLFHLKIYKAQQIQTESVTASVLRRVYISDETREQLQTITEIPAVVMMILDSVGKYKTPDEIFHCGYFIPAEDEAEYLQSLSLCINPDNIRDILQIMTHPDTDPEWLAYWRNHCTIPGVSFTVNNHISNIDDVWPENAIQRLPQDIHDFKNWITRVQQRLPKHATPKIEWSGLASGGVAWSTEILDVKVTSLFKDVQAPAAKRAKRTASGRLYEEEQLMSKYISSTITSERGSFWSRISTPHTALVSGCASLIGEVCGLLTRVELNCPEAAVVSPVDVMYTVSDAPR